MTFIFAFLAGVLSILSPCVLPLLPLIIGSAVAKSRYGLYALCLGLALSFALFGLFFATIGFSLGINQNILRYFAAVVVIAMGVFLVFPTLFNPISLGLTRFTNPLENYFAGKLGGGVFGQFLTGALLGVIWTPCVGPTLGAATILAAKGENLLEVTLTMLVFGFGAAIPLLIIGVFALKNLGHYSQKITKFKKTFGVVLIFIGGLILTGYDKIIEAYLTDKSPEWLTKLTTYF